VPEWPFWWLQAQYNLDFIASVIYKKNYYTTHTSIIDPIKISKHLGYTNISY